MKYVNCVCTSDIGVQMYNYTDVHDERLSGD